MLFSLLISCADVAETTSSEDVVSVEQFSSDDTFTYQEESTEEETVELEPAVEYSCAAGIEQWNSCFDQKMPFDLECTDSTFDELALIQSLSCDELYSSLRSLPLCDTLGLNCAEDYYGCADAQIDAHDYRQILELSDTRTVRDIEDIADRIAGLREIFVSYGDLRGAFASVYSPITDSAVESVSRGDYEDNDWAEDLIVDFAGRYFDNLRLSMLDMRTTQSWDRYYELSQMCNVKPLRVAVHGVMVHLVVDLPHTLVAIETEEHMRQDYDDFGMELVGQTQTIVHNLRDDYGMDAAPFFRGFFLGDWIDSLAGDGATTMFAFQTIRSKAWNNGMWLQDWRAGMAESEIYASWRAADGMLATWDIMQ